MNTQLILLQRFIIMTPYFTSGHQSSSCKGACTDVIRIQTQNGFCCFPSVTIEPLHYLLNFRVFLHSFLRFFFHILGLNYYLSVYKDLMWNVPMAEYHAQLKLAPILPDFILGKFGRRGKVPYKFAIRNVFLRLADHEDSVL